MVTRAMIGGSLALLLLVAAGCASGEGTPYEETLDYSHKHSFDFMWEEIQAALRQQYDIESADPVTRHIDTAWQTNLSAMSHFGYRTKLEVTLEGDVVDGYKVKVKELTERNTNQVNPLAESEAEWEPDEADGGSAARFQMALFRRLNPREPWRENDAR